MCTQRDFCARIVQVFLSNSPSDVFSALIKLMHEGVESEMSAARCLELVMKVKFTSINDVHFICFF